MKRILIIILLICALAETATAQRITRSFQNVSMSDALKYIQQQTGNHKIVFIYNELEDFTITTNVKNKPVPDAIRQIIGFYPIKMIQGDNNDIYVECTHKTEHHLKGMVVDENNLPLPYANVTLLSPADSSMVGGGVTNESGRFVIPNDHGKVIARITYVGYKTEYRLCARDNVGTIKMHPDVTALKETVVTTARMQIERDGANYTIRNMAGTIMGNAGNALDMLRWTPGVIVKMNEEISLIGRDGKTEVYIDNRKITNNSELKAITSQNIKRVEIIREPDAQYASDVVAVVKVFTRKPVKNYLGASLINVLDIKRRVSDMTTLNIDGKQGKLSGNASFTYGYTDTHSSGSQLTSVTYDTSLFQMNDSVDYWGGGNNYRVFAGFNYAPTEKSLFGIQYNGTFSETKLNTVTDKRIINASEKRLMNNFTYMNHHRYRNSLSASYSWQRTKESELLLIADYASSNNHDKQNIVEKDMDTEEEIIHDINNVNDYRILTATAKYNFVSNQWKNNIGTEWGHISSDGNVLMSENSQLSSRKNDWLATYYTMSHSWEKWRIGAGLRYEYDFTRTVFDGKTMSKTYHNLLPDVHIGYKLSKDLDFMLYYRRTLRRPSFYELRPTSYYLNSYMISTGNPKLQAMVTDRVALNINIKGFSWSMAYSNKNNTIQNILEQLETGMFCGYPINIKHSYAWSFDLSYNYRNSWLNLSAQSSATLPHTKYPYLGRERIESTPYATLNINAQFTLERKYIFGCDAIYLTPWTKGLTRTGSVLEVNLSAMTILCKGHLLLGLNLNDFFRRRQPHWERKQYMNVYSENNIVSDTRGISLMARWTFSAIKNPFKKRSGNDNTLLRVE